MEQKFAKASLLTDVLSLVALYIVHVVLIIIAALIGEIAIGIYAVICVIIALTTKTDRSDIDNWIARALLSPIMMPFFLSRRIRPYSWIFATNMLIPKMNDAEVKQAYDRLSSIDRQVKQLHNDPQWKDRDFDFLGIKDEMVWGCRTWGEAETLFEHIEGECEGRKKGKV